MSRVFLVFCLVASLAMLPSLAGEKHKCSHSTQDCLMEMAKKLKGKGVIGLDGEWEEKTGGYRVSRLVEGTTAKEAGVRPGDLLTKVNGIPLTEQEAYAADAANRKPGQEATITILREEKELTMTVTLMEITEQMMAEEIGLHMLAYHLKGE